MPYVCSLLPIDLGGFFASTPPVLSGRFTPVGGSPPASFVLPNPAAPFTVSFPTAVPPPPGAVTIHLTDVGDIFRSGPMTALPPSPGLVTAVSAPLSATTFPITALVPRLAALTPLMLFPPSWMTTVTAVATGGAFTPTVGAITGLVPTLGVPAGTLALTLTGFFSGRAWFTIPTTFTFTGTINLTPRPSGDANDRARVLSVAVNSVSLSANGFGVFLGLLGPFVGGLLGPLIESALNGLIGTTVASGISGLGLILSPTSVLSARRVTIAPSGIALQLVLADLLGPAVILPPPPPKLFAVAVAPVPQAAVPQTYTVTVTEAATGAVVPGADVALHNFPNNGPVVTQHKTTDALGHAVFAVTLEGRFLDIEHKGHEREKFLAPSLTVTKAGFFSLTRKLL